MVAPRDRRRSGKVPIRFLLTLLLVGGAVFYGIGPARGYLKYYVMKDEMQVQARFAVNLSDTDIRRRLRAKATELKLPSDAQHITIRRRGRPREITVSTSWPDTIVLPFYTIPFTYRPSVRAPL